VLQPQELQDKEVLEEQVPDQGYLEEMKLLQVVVAHQHKVAKELQIQVALVVLVLHHHILVHQ
jgi:hypothetical protein